MPKPLTKALHTTRVVSQIARYIATYHDSTNFDAESLYAAVLEVLGNGDATDAALNVACLKACEEVLS